MMFSLTMYKQNDSLEMFNPFMTWIIVLEMLNPLQPKNRLNHPIESFNPIMTILVTM